MDAQFTSEENAFRMEVRAFMEASVPPSIRHKMLLGQRWTREDMVTWQRILDDKAWGAPGWPVEWGGTGWTGVQLYIFREELNRARGIDQLNQNMNLAGPIVIAFGSQEQKAHFLPRIRSMEYWFCQGFSEPQAGSDLARLDVRAGAY